MTPEERQLKLTQLKQLKRQQQEKKLQQLLTLKSEREQQQPAQQPEQISPQLTENEQVRQSGQSAYDSMSPLGKFGVGTAKSAIQTWYGLRDLFGDDLSAEELRTLERLAGTEGGWATAGGLAGELATFALPAAKLGQFVTKLASSAPKLLAKAAPFLADMGLTVGVEGAKAADSETTRTDRMSEAAQGYLATTAGLKFLGKIKNGLKEGFITPTKAAQELMDKGIKLTPNQASEGKNGLINAIENFMEYTPFTGAKVTDMKTRNLADWNKTLFNDPKVNPLPAEQITSPGGKGFKQLQQNFKKAYDDVWANAELTPANTDFPRLNNAFNNAMNNADELVGVNAAPQFKKLIKDSTNSLNQYYKTGNTKFLSDADDMLRDAKIDDFASTGEINKIRDEIRDSMPNNLGNRLREVDQNYANYAVLQRGGSYVDALKNNQELAPTNLMSAVKAKGKERQLSTAEALMQKEAQTGIDVFGNYRPKNSVLRKTLGAAALVANPAVGVLPTIASRPLANDAMSDFIIKGVPETKQQALSNVLRTMGEVTGVTRAKKFAAPSLTAEELNRLLNRAGGLYGDGSSNEY